MASFLTVLALCAGTGSEHDALLERVRSIERRYISRARSGGLTTERAASLHAALNAELNDLFESVAEDGVESLDVEDLVIFVGLGERLGKIDEAQKGIERARRVAPDDSRFVGPAIRLLLAGGRYAEAETAFAAAKRRFPNRPEVAETHTSFVDCYRRRNMAAAAARHFPSMFDSHLSLLKTNHEYLYTLHVVVEVGSRISQELAATAATPMWEHCRQSLIAELQECEEVRDHGNHAFASKEGWRCALLSVLSYMHRHYKQHDRDAVHTQWLDVFISDGGRSGPDWLDRVQAAVLQLTVESCQWREPRKIHAALLELLALVRTAEASQQPPSGIVASNILQLLKLAELRARHLAMAGKVIDEGEPFQSLLPASRHERPFTSGLHLYCPAARSLGALPIRIAAALSKDEFPDTELSITFVHSGKLLPDAAADREEKLVAELQKIDFQGRFRFVGEASTEVIGIAGVMLPQWIITTAEGRVHEIVVGSDDLRLDILRKGIASAALPRAEKQLTCTTRPSVVVAHSPAHKPVVRCRILRLLCWCSIRRR